MLIVDKYSSTPIYEQIVDGIEKEILLGFLREGDAVASVRELSVTLGINPNTIQKAYIELERRGVTIALSGRGSFVREGALDSIREREKKKIERLRSLARELRLAGIDKAELIAAIECAYKEADK